MLLVKSFLENLKNCFQSHLLSLFLFSIIIISYIFYNVKIFFLRFFRVTPRFLVTLPWLDNSRTTHPGACPFLNLTILLYHFFRKIQSLKCTKFGIFFCAIFLQFFLDKITDICYNGKLVPHWWSAARHYTSSRRFLSRAKYKKYCTKF